MRIIILSLTLLFSFTLFAQVKVEFKADHFSKKQNLFYSTTYVNGDTIKSTGMQEEEEEEEEETNYQLKARLGVSYQKSITSEIGLALNKYNLHWNGIGTITDKDTISVVQLQ